MSAAARTLWGHLGTKVGIALLALLGIGVTVYLATRGAPPSPVGQAPSGPQPAMMANPAQGATPGHGEPRPVPPPPRKNVTLKFVVGPAKAKVEVVFRGQTYRGALFKAVIPPSTTMEKVLVKAKGFVTQTLVVTPTENNTFTVSLRPSLAPGMRPVMRRRARPPRPASGAGLLKTKLE